MRSDREEDGTKTKAAGVRCGTGLEGSCGEGAKKAKHDKPITFRRKAHCEQFDFNKRVAECLENAADKITKRPTDATSPGKPRWHCLTVEDLHV